MNTTPSSTPHEPKPGITLSRQALAVLVSTFLLLLALVIGGSLYLITKKDEPAANNQASQQTPASTDSSSQNTPSEPLQSGIRTDDPEFTIQIDSIEAGSNSMTINFSVVCTTSDLCFTDGLWKNSDVLASAYIVDDAAQQKYEVVKDANGKIVASEIGKTSALRNGEKLGYFVNITKPPKDATVTIYLPNVQPISGITIEK